MFSPSREQARRFLVEAWKKRVDRLPATPLETIAADVVSMHPEYHRLLEGNEDALEKDWNPDQGDTNPFLHLSLHLAIAEQLQIDQPPGIRAAYQQLLPRSGDNHEALHHLLDCLAETIWRAQRDQKPLDSEHYLALMEEKVRSRSGR